MRTDAYERYCKLRDSLGYKDSAVASGANVSKSTLSDWKSGRYVPKGEKMTKIASFLGVTADYLISGEDSDSGKNMNNAFLAENELELIRKYRSLDTYGREMIDFTLTHEVKRVNDIQAMQNEISALHEEKQNRRTYAYYGKIAAAGTSVPWDGLFNEPIECEECERGADFTIGVSGDSMEPTFYDGDIVFVKKVEHIGKGEIGIFQKDNAIYIKEVGDGCLISHNAKYAPISGEDVSCLGKVIGKVK